MNQIIFLPDSTQATVGAKKAFKRRNQALYTQEDNEEN